MIPIPQKDTQRYEIMLNKLGPTTLEFLIELAEQFNALELRCEPTIIPVDDDYEIRSSSVNPPEESHARSQA